MGDATELLRCSCIHVPCYETDGVEMMTFLACAYICDAMLLQTSPCYTTDGHVPGWERCLSLHVHTCEILRKLCVAVAHRPHVTHP